MGGARWGCYQTALPWDSAFCTPALCPPPLALPQSAWRLACRGSPTPVSCAGACTTYPGSRRSRAPSQGLPRAQAPPNLWAPPLPHASPSPTGEHLRICPQGYTCCTSEMEEKLANRSRAELETALLDSSRALQTTLAAQLQSFDGERAPRLGAPRTLTPGELGARAPLLARREQKAACTQGPSWRPGARELSAGALVCPAVCTAVHAHVWGDRAHPSVSLSEGTLLLSRCLLVTGRQGQALPWPGQGTEAGAVLLWGQEASGAPGVAFVSSGQLLGMPLIP